MTDWLRIGLLILISFPSGAAATGDSATLERRASPAELDLASLRALRREDFTERWRRVPSTLHALADRTEMPFDAAVDALVRDVFRDCEIVVHRAWLDDADKEFATEVFAFALGHLDRIELDNLYWSRVRFYVRGIDVAGRNAFLHEVARTLLRLTPVLGEDAATIGRAELNLVRLLEEYPNPAAVSTFEMLAASAPPGVARAARAALERLSSHDGPHGECLKNEARAAIERARRPGPLTRCAAWLGLSDGRRAPSPSPKESTLYN